MSVLLHLPFDVHSVAVGSVLDYSPFRREVLASGSFGLTNDAVKYGSYAGNFNAAGALLTIGQTDYLNFGAGDFTIETWCRITSAPAVGRYPGLIGMRTLNSLCSWTAFLNGDDGRVYFGFSKTGTSIQYVAGPAGSVAQLVNNFGHVAIVRNGSTITVYVNGIGGTPSSVIGTDALYTFSGPLRIGILEPNNSIHDFIGQLDDLRIDDTALYTSNFTPAEITYTPRPLVTSRTVDLLDLHAYDVPEARGYRDLAERGSYPFYYNGRGRIPGTVKRKASPVNLPLVRRVRLHEQLTGNFVAETWSDTSGNYAFEYLDPVCSYYTVGFDHTGAYRGVIADNLTPELM